MRSRKLIATMTLVALLGSDLVVAGSPALAQMPSQSNGNGNGYQMTPSLGGSDGAYGRVLPGPGTTAPYIGGPQPQMLPPIQQSPQMIQRPAGPAGPNLCQPGVGGQRPYQTVSIPRSRGAEPLPFQQTPPGAQVAQGGTITQVTVSQTPAGTPGTAGPLAQPPQQQPVVDPRAASVGTAPTLPDVDEFSRIEAGFNLDSVRVQQIGSFQPQAQFAAQQPQSRQQQTQQALLAQLPPSQQRPGIQEPMQAYLGPYGTPLRQYGYAMFAANVSTFAPVDDIPVGPDYVMGPGDDLTINVWGAVDSTLIRTVDRNGRIVLPKVGDLRI